jgi:hypothetical protein
VAACGINRVSTQEEQHMDIAEVFRGDRGRLVSGTACQTPGNAPDPPQVVPGMEEAMGRFPPAAIVAGPCNDRLATQETEQMDIMSLLRSDRCTVVLPKSSKSPGNSSKNAKDKKKIAGWGPSGAKSPAKRWFMAVKVCRKRGHFMPKRPQSTSTGVVEARTDSRLSRAFAVN